MDKNDDGRMPARYAVLALVIVAFGLGLAANRIGLFSANDAPAQASATQALEDRDVYYPGTEDLAPERVDVVGQPVSLKFATKGGAKADLRRRLNIDLERPGVLIVGGGDGIGPLYEIARAVATRVPNAQLLIVTGRNRSARRAEVLEAMAVSLIADGP